MKKITKEDLSPEVLLKIREALHENKDWKRLEVKYAKALKFGNFIVMSQTKALMNKIENDCIQAYCDSCKDEQVTMAELFKGMPKKDAERLRELLDSIYFILDTLDSLILDTNSLLQKNCPDCELAFYDKIRELRQETQFHINGVLGKTGDTQSELICKYSDMVISYAIKKAKMLLKEEKQIERNKASVR